MTKTILITGANRGLGFEFARQYVTDGWRVFAACRNPATASELRRLAQDRGGRLTVLAMDVTDMGGPKAPLSPQESVTAMRRLIETLGPDQSGKFYNSDGCEYPW
jgi:NAD(P)-dependent dehydrogenase (short-subunit alcohol dehydrogenase family)